MADLIERKDALNCLDNRDFDSYEDYSRTFDAIEDIPAVNRWISVEDALPEEGTRVIAVVDGESHEAIFSYNAFHGSNFYRDKCDIERWMPMPEPPEKE